MAGYEFSFSGLDELEKKLESIKEQKAVKNCVKKHVENMGRLAQKTVPVDTGHLKNSMRVTIGEFDGTVSFNTDYAGYVEYGTRKMYARHYMKEAFDMEKEQFRKDMEDIFR